MFIPKPIVFIAAALLGIWLLPFATAALPFLLILGAAFFGYRYFSKKQLSSIANEARRPAPWTHANPPNLSSGNELVDRATESATAGLQARIGPLRSEWGPGISPGFWKDAYVLGFTFSTIGHWAKFATNGAISGADLGEVAERTYSTLTGQPGAIAVRKALTLLQAKDSEFMRGGHEANLSFKFGMGTLEDEDSYPNVVEAKKAAKAMEGGYSRGGVAALLAMGLRERAIQSAS